MRVESQILIGTILVLVPAVAGLLIAYSAAVQSRNGELLPLPDPIKLIGTVREIDLGPDSSTKLIYNPDQETNTGIARVYRISVGNEPLYYLVVFRHDIDCEICKDFVAAAIFGAVRRELVEIILTEPWEISGKLIATEDFLAQFEGRTFETPLRLGADIDNITGATRSALGMVERLNEVHAWLAEWSRKEKQL